MLQVTKESSTSSSELIAKQTDAYSSIPVSYGAEGKRSVLVKFAVKCVATFRKEFACIIAVVFFYLNFASVAADPYRPFPTILSALKECLHRKIIVINISFISETFCSTPRELGGLILIEHTSFCSH